MPAKHLLSVAQLGPDDLVHLIDRSIQFASQRLAGKPLDNKIVGTYFRKPSTRTRTSFTVGALKLGARVVAYGPNDLQIVTGETVADTVKVLSCYLDALVIRTNEDFSEMSAWASQDQLSIINAMSENEHPTQAIADLSTVKEAFNRLKGIHILYLGEGNNTAAALALAVAQVRDMKITFVTPEGYGLQEAILRQAHLLARINGAAIEHHHRVDKLPKTVDVVYTTRWQTMGQPHPDPDWREKFMPYSVTAALMSRVSKSSATIFLHDLPAVRGEDVADEVLNGRQSAAWRQARYKMFTAMAILEWCIGASRAEPKASVQAAIRTIAARNDSM